MRHLWSGIGLVAAMSGATAGAATIERFVPQGEIRSVRQMQARFSEDMVRFGDQNLPSPFDVACPVAGRGRWIDARNWAYDLERDAPPGVKCSFTPKPGLKSLAGAAVTGRAAYGFSTGGPAVIGSEPYAGGAPVATAGALGHIPRRRSVKGK
jgi:hypothetical protein